MKYRVTIPMDGEATYVVDAENRDAAMNIIRQATQKDAPGDCCTNARFTLLYCGATVEVVEGK